MDSLYGSFDDTDRDMLGMLANQGAVALDNAGLLAGLEQKIHERTAELQSSNANLEQRNDELAILNSVGDAMAKTLDVKTVAKIVGDKVRDIFKAEIVSIMLLNEQTNLIHVLYEYDQGEGGYVDCQLWHLVTQALPLFDLQAGLPQHPSPNQYNQPVFFSYWNKFKW